MESANHPKKDARPLTNELLAVISMKGKREISLALSFERFVKRVVACSKV